MVYLVLVLTVGFVLLTTDIAIGRKTGKMQSDAYESIRKKWKFLGVYIPGSGIDHDLLLCYRWMDLKISDLSYKFRKEAAADDYFTSFITSPSSVFMLIFPCLTALIVYSGVEKGIERFSKIIMPVLLIMIGSSQFSH